MQWAAQVYSRSAVKPSILFGQDDLSAETDEHWRRLLAAHQVSSTIVASGTALLTKDRGLMAHDNRYVQVSSRGHTRPRSIRAQSHPRTSSDLTMGGQALRHLGVPIVLGVSSSSLLSCPRTVTIRQRLLITYGGLQIYTIVVRDEDYQAAIRKLLDSQFVSTVPNRNLRPEVMEHLLDPQAVLAEINKGYRRLDQSSTTFDHPSHCSERKEQVVLIPNSFAHLPLAPASSTLDASGPRPTFPTSHYDAYGNLFYPLEEALTESFVKAAIDDEKDTNISLWGESLRSWISMMVGYLDVNNDILDACEDKQAVEWFSTHFGRAREAVYGPMDYRVTKRLGSGKEMPVDMRGRPVVSD
jgi:hypothetical protein